MTLLKLKAVLRRAKRLADKGVLSEGEHAALCVWALFRLRGKTFSSGEVVPGEPLRHGVDLQGVLGASGFWPKEIEGLNRWMAWAHDAYGKTMQASGTILANETGQRLVGTSLVWNDEVEALLVSARRKLSRWNRFEDSLIEFRQRHPFWSAVVKWGVVTLGGGVIVAWVLRLLGP